MERLSHNHPDHVNELLSAYIDDVVDLGERRRAATYIETCPACAQEVRELRMFRELLRDLPNVQPQRSFTLDPATVAPRRLLFPTFRWASLVAALLFLVVVGVDTLAVGGNAGFSTASAPGIAQNSPPAVPAQGESTGGAAETMMLPASTAASVFEGGQGAAGASGAPVAAEVGPTSLAVGRQTTTAGETGATAGGAAPQVPAYPPVAGGAAPDMARSAPAEDSSGAAAGTTFSADEPAGADTTELDPSAAQGSWWSSLTLRFVEVGLGLIALLLGIAALWTWRRQV